MNYFKEISLLLIGGLVTHFFYLKYGHRKEKKEEVLRKEVQRINRPEFVITNMKDYFDNPGSCVTDNQLCDMEVFVAQIDNVYVKEDTVIAEYNDMIFDKKSWVCRQYTLKNIGKTVVYEIALISNFKKTTCIFDISIINNRLNDFGMLNYHDLLDKRIAPNESITLKLFYNKDKIPVSFISAGFEIGMRDDNGNYWFQPFFAPEDKLYESRRIPHERYTDSIRPDQAVECFQKPYLW